MAKTAQGVTYIKWLSIELLSGISEFLCFSHQTLHSYKSNKKPVMNISQQQPLLSPTSRFVVSHFADWTDYRLVTLRTENLINHIQSFCSIWSEYLHELVSQHSSGWQVVQSTNSPTSNSSDSEQGVIVTMIIFLDLLLHWIYSISSDNGP